ncbi:MAG: protein-glutamate O-methyltransferase CheR [Bacteriovoracaceae bacterium]|jgi:chemotaxis protein methyltransferase CheR|nr:protein-glutamate O-methyltransferase CheR [Bacteriovoracaceae bacterium]
MEISEKVYMYFADLIKDRLGIEYPISDRYRLDARISTLIEHFNVDSADALHQIYIQNMTTEMETVLLDLATNNETSFFRDSKPFDFLTKIYIPHFVKGSPLGPLKIWSCACSTGQEPLSTIMTIKEGFPSLAGGFVKLDASDISSEALAKAKNGEYTQLEVQRGIPITLLVKYFDKVDDKDVWKVKNSIIKHIRHFSFNLLTGSYQSGNYNIIFCRNILIYQNKENKEKILNSLDKQLHQDGIIILGNGESLIGLKTPLQTINIDGFTIIAKESSEFWSDKENHTKLSA